MYYEEYKGERLSELVADIQPPKGFVARVVLSEGPLKEMPFYIERQMILFMAPEETMKIYMDGYKYENQMHKEKLIGVDSSCYQLEIDGRNQEFYTGADGYWGNMIEFTHIQDKKPMVDAFIVTATIPDGMDYEDMRHLVTCLFSDVQLISEQAEKEGLQIKME